MRAGTRVNDIHRLFPGEVWVGAGNERRIPKNQRESGQAENVFWVVSGKKAVYGPKTRKYRVDMPLNFGIRRSFP